MVEIFAFLWFSSIYGAFARLRASVCVLMQTFGPFKLSLSNISESRVKWSRRDVWSDGLLLSSDNRFNQYKCFRDRVIYCSINLTTWLTVHRVCKRPSLLRVPTILIPSSRVCVHQPKRVGAHLFCASVGKKQIFENNFGFLNVWCIPIFLVCIRQNYKRWSEYKVLFAILNQTQN